MKNTYVVTYAQYLILDTVASDSKTHISQDNKKTALRLVAKQYLRQIGEFEFRITKTGRRALTSKNLKIIR